MKRPFLFQIVVVAATVPSACGAYASADRLPLTKKPRQVPKVPFVVWPYNKQMSPRRTKAREVSPKKAHVRYSLGIGKNPPVARTKDMVKSSFPSSSDDQYEACRFLMEHQSVRDYPSPSQQRAELEAATRIQPTSRKASNKPESIIRYNRQSEDVLVILESPIPSHTRSNSNRKARRATPTIVAHTSMKLDLNTPWVEMLLHCEQSKLSKR